MYVRGAKIYVFDNSDSKPFTAKFDNVTVFDNTKGKIINFDVWLNKYPNKTSSNGKVNKWGSAKHCYSVERCMQLLKENFMLLDSDVLLKKDVSDLFDDKYIYVGETIVQPKSTVRRVLPFMCFINVEMCKKNNVHYFDDNYMHGLCNTKVNKFADRYDTGAGFYVHCKNLPHKDIKLKDYVVHFGHGSWNKRGYVQPVSESDWLLINRKYWRGDMNENVIYTCIVGDYDVLKNPVVISPGYDYVCFTDNKEFSSDVWDIRPLPKETDELPNIKKQRFVKINPHLFLPEYKLSIWVDGNVDLRGDVNEVVKSVLKDDCSVYVPKHPTRDCIYKEAGAVVSMRKDKRENVDPQMARYRKEGFPNSYGLLQSNILFRKHNNKDCIKLMEAWSREVMGNSHRDQLSFNYASWKNSDVKVHYLDKAICKSKWFLWNGIHGKKNKSKKVEKKPIVKASNTTVTPIKKKVIRKFETKPGEIKTHQLSIYE